MDSLEFCSKEKGLVIHAWVIMSNHMHIICRASNGYELSNIIRDFKKYTAKHIIESIIQFPESRRDWLLYRFEFNGKYNKRVKKYKFRKDDNHAILIDTAWILEQKLTYLHENPVKERIVTEAEEYLFSSAKDYSGGKGLLDIELIN